MNLIRDAWLPVIRASGKKDKIAPWQIAERVDPVIEVNAPRPDFQGALYQFLIGLLQTCYAPADHDEWLDLWENPPAEDMLQAKFTNVASAFELDDPTGPAFMQDFNLPKGEMRNIATLLMDFPGDKTIVDNLDHFVKRGSVAKMCPACAAMALFTLQINAPAGGNGHRVGLRGGGPLTTLVKPTEDLDLWSKLWLNVLNAEDIADSIEKPTADVFPWMGPTRVSTQKVVNKIKHYIGEGVPTTPADAHPLQHYWGMPRRIRILSRADAIGKCNLCGDDSANVVSDCRTGTWGVDYVGAWVHPLTPYRFDANKEKPPLSFKGQEGGVGYRDWIALVLAHSDKGECAAKCARVYMDQRARDIGDQRFARLWCFGYDMNKMQARCWY
ncbi:MAG: type I-E CRISPR-associated protein Cse1/CasA, partial [Syntrophobacterales bacterium CG_4_9_14_3_um_filter_49_8]